MAQTEMLLTNAVDDRGTLGTASRIGGGGGGGGGGVEKFVVTIEYDNGAYTADKTFAEILAAYQAGKLCYAVYADDVSMDLFQCEVGAEACFASVIPSDLGISVFGVVVGADDSVIFLSQDFAKDPTKVVDASTSVTLALAADNTIYDYDELSALTVTAMPSSGWCEFRFKSGSTATTTNFPADLVFPTANGLFAGAGANKRYAINCEKQADGTWLALVGEWPYTPTP